MKENQGKRRGKPLIGCSRPLQRASAYLGITKRCLYKYAGYSEISNLRNRQAASTSTKKSSCRSKVDSFDKSVIKNATLSLIRKNKNVDLKSLKSYLNDEKDIHITKYSLWKALHYQNKK